MSASQVLEEASPEVAAGILRRVMGDVLGDATSDA
jgi:hypothetical protein